MAARTSIPFLTAFEDAVRPTGLLAAMAADATLKASLLGQFNRTHKIGYDLPVLANTLWEDSRVWAEITPVAGLIGWDSIGEGRGFEIYAADPRETAEAATVPLMTDKAGIRVDTSYPSVWMSWQPRCYPFDTTAWATSTAYTAGQARVSGLECYRCLVSHTSGTFATDLSAGKWLLMPVLEVLNEFLIRHLHATYLRESGQTQTGASLQEAARNDLLEIHRAELRRIQLNQR